MAGKKVEIVIDVVQGKTGAAKKLVDDLEKDVLASQKRVAAAHKATDRAIAESQKQTVNSAKMNAKSSADAFLRELERMKSGAKQSATSIQGSLKDAFGGGLIGGAAAPPNS